GGGVGGEERIAGAGGEDHHAALLQVTDGTAADEVLADLVDLDGAHYPGDGTAALERVLHGQRVDDRGQHAHVVAGDPVHALGGQPGAAEDVSATDDHADLAAEVDHLVDLPGDAPQCLRIDAVVGIAHERLAGEFQQDTRVLQAHPDISGRQQNGGIVMDAAPCGQNCARAAA